MHHYPVRTHSSDSFPDADGTRKKRPKGCCDVRGGLLLATCRQWIGAGRLTNDVRETASSATLREESRPRGRNFRRKWTGPESNRRHQDFQSCALPTELPVRIAANRNKVKIIGEWPEADNRRFPVRKAADFAACGFGRSPLPEGRLFRNAKGESWGRTNVACRFGPMTRSSDHTKVDQHDASSVIDPTEFALTISRVLITLERTELPFRSDLLVTKRTSFSWEAMRRVLVEEKS